MTKWFTTSGGIRIAYHEVGAGDPAIIFIHGAYSNRRGFGFQEEYFSYESPLHSRRSAGPR